MNILAQIAEYTSFRVDCAKRLKPFEILQKEAFDVNLPEFGFEKSIKKANAKGEIAFICEIKKASPSKGLISEDFDYINIAKDYQNAGAAAISVLTEPKWFMGENKFLTEISKTVATPLLRKDFIIDEYQIYVAKAIGASAVLFIVSLLEKSQLSYFIGLANGLGLSSLVEVHDENELESAIEADARIIGINNRNLKTFDVDLNTTLRLADRVPDDVIFVSESGIKEYEDIKKLQKAGVSSVLIGETLMRSKDKAKMIENLRTGGKI